MKYCAECNSSEEEVAFIDEFRNQLVCSCCLNEDPDYWRKKYYDLRISYKEMEKRIIEIDKKKKHKGHKRGSSIVWEYVERNSSICFRTIYGQKPKERRKRNYVKFWTRFFSAKNFIGVVKIKR